MNGTIVVKREDGRVDIKIEAPEWTVIVENKINGAMDRQLPRYLEQCGGQNRVKAIVYLVASDRCKKEPDTDGWSEEEKKRQDASAGGGL